MAKKTTAKKTAKKASKKSAAAAEDAAVDALLSGAASAPSLTPLSRAAAPEPEPMPAPTPEMAPEASPANAAGGEEVIKTKKPKAPVVPVIKEIISVGEELDEIDEDAEGGAEAELQKMERKWWLEEPWRSLLDPELVKNQNFLNSDLSDLINQFVDKMLKENIIDFRISGMAIYSTSKLHHAKISSVIKDEQKLKEEEVKERTKRMIPNAIAQPLREARKLASADELFGAMRRAILETMQNREKLRIRREKSEAKKVQKVIVKGQGKLPAEILKHITGSEETIEERLQKWQQRIKEIIRLEGQKEEFTSFDRLKMMINEEIKESYGRRLKYIQCFEALLFLLSLNKIYLSQETMRSPVIIRIRDKTLVELKQ